MWGQSSKSQCESNILSTHNPLIPCQSALPFLRYSIFKILPWISKVDVWAQGHKVGITTYWLVSLSFHVDRPSNYLDVAISKLGVKIQGQGHGWGQSWKSQHGSNIQSTHIPFAPCQLGIPCLSDDFLKSLPWKSRVKVIKEVTVQRHNMGLTSYLLLKSISSHVNRPHP